MVNVEPLPKWIMRRYARMWQLMKDREFTFNEMLEALREDKKVLLTIHSHLRRMGWLTVKLNDEDARKRIYKLKKPEIIVEAMN